MLGRHRSQPPGPARVLANFLALSRRISCTSGRRKQRVARPYARRRPDAYRLGTHNRTQVYSALPAHPPRRPRSRGPKEPAWSAWICCGQDPAPLFKRGTPWTCFLSLLEGYFHDKRALFPTSENIFQPPRQYRARRGGQSLDTVATDIGAFQRSKRDEKEAASTDIEEARSTFTSLPQGNRSPLHACSRTKKDWVESNIIRKDIVLRR